MTSQILLSVDQARLSAAPGAQVELIVTVQNLTTLLDQVALRVEGIDPAWVQVIPPNLPVFAQGSAQARVLIRPQRQAAPAIAGVYPLRVVGKAQENAGEEGEATSELEVQLIGDYRLALESGASDGVQQMTYKVALQNDANAPLQVRFSAHDDADALWYKFDPLQLAIPPGAAATATLTARAKALSGAPRAIPFTAGARGEFALQGGQRNAAPAHQVVTQFVQGQPPRLKLAVWPAGVAAGGAVYDIQVTNPGPLTTPVTLSASDVKGALQYQFDAPQLTVAPGGAGNSRLTVRPILAAPPTGPTVTPFRVVAQPAGVGLNAESAEATFAQAGAAPAPPQPQPFPWWIAIVVGLGILAIILAILAIYLLRGG
jgi:hypothetical protein